MLRACSTLLLLCGTRSSRLHEEPIRHSRANGLRSFVNEEVAPNVDAWDEAGEVPWEVHAKLGALGVWGFGIDEAYGGLGFDDAFMRAIYSEELSLPGAGGVWAALNGRMISVEPIARLANKEIKDRALADIVAGRAGSCLGITEPGGGSDVAAMTTTARKDGDHYVLNGSKTFITGGMNASYFVVGARTGDKGLGGISLFFVDEGTPGFERTLLERKMGWWASDQATLYFNDCRVPASHLMGEENRGFLAIMENFNWERMGLIAGCLGMMRACLSESIYNTMGAGAPDLWQAAAAAPGDPAQDCRDVVADRRGGCLPEPHLLADERGRHARRRDLQVQVLHHEADGVRGERGHADPGRRRVLAWQPGGATRWSACTAKSR